MCLCPRLQLIMPYGRYMTAAVPQPLAVDGTYWPEVLYIKHAKVFGLSMSQALR